MLGRRPDISIGLPSPEALAELRAVAISPQEWTKNHKLPHAAKEVLLVPDEIWDGLIRLWLHCPVEKIMQDKAGRFRLTLELHESREGFVVLYAEGSLTGGKPVVGFMLIDDDDAIKLDFPYTDMSPQPTKEELAWLRSIWVPFNPVGTIRVGKEPRPNDRCKACGRKVKRCVCAEIAHHALTGE
jgi:hypothetical protein